MTITSKVVFFPVLVVFWQFRVKPRIYLLVYNENKNLPDLKVDATFYVCFWSGSDLDPIWIWSGSDLDLIWIRSGSVSITMLKLSWLSFHKSHILLVNGPNCIYERLAWSLFSMKFVSLFDLAFSFILS